MAVEDRTPNLTAVVNSDKTEISFYSYGIFTLPILPILLLVIHIFLLQIPQIYLLIWLIIVVYLLVPGKKEKNLESSTIFTRLIYLLVELSFGVKTSKKNTHQLRIEWRFF